MKVQGYEITEDQISAGIAAMVGKFRASNVWGAMFRAGVQQENWVAHRAADRLLQQERKSGRIRYEKGWWVSQL